MAKKKPSVEEALAQLEARFERFEDLVSWFIPASSRFQKGQRVQLNRKAEKQGIGKRCKTRKGTVTGVSDGLGVDVLLDGYKHASGFHHSFFDPIGKAVRR